MGWSIALCSSSPPAVSVTRRAWGTTSAGGRKMVKLSALSLSGNKLLKVQTQRSSMTWVPRTSSRSEDTTPETC